MQFSYCFVSSVNTSCKCCLRLTGNIYSEQLLMLCFSWLLPVQMQMSFVHGSSLTTLLNLHYFKQRVCAACYGIFYADNRVVYIGTVFFLYTTYILYTLSHLTAVAGISSSVLGKGGKEWHLCFAPDLKGKNSFWSVLLAVKSLHMFFNNSMKWLLFLIFQISFDGWYLIWPLFASVDMIMWFSFFNMCVCVWHACV